MSVSEITIMLLKIGEVHTGSVLYPSELDAFWGIFLT